MNTFAFNLEVFVKKKEPTEIIKTFLAEKKNKYDFHVCLVIKYHESKFSCGNSI